MWLNKTSTASPEIYLYLQKGVLNWPSPWQTHTHTSITPSYLFIWSLSVDKAGLTWRQLHLLPSHTLRRYDSVWYCGYKTGLTNRQLLMNSQPFRKTWPVMSHPAVGKYMHSSDSAHQDKCVGHEVRKVLCNCFGGSTGRFVVSEQHHWSDIDCAACVGTIRVYTKPGTQTGDVGFEIHQCCLQDR